MGHVYRMDGRVARPALLSCKKTEVGAPSRLPLPGCGFSLDTLPMSRFDRACPEHVEGCASAFWSGRRSAPNAIFNTGTEYGTMRPP
jgi:hypothetical protein